jgi:hypothetical protein
LAGGAGKCICIDACDTAMLERTAEQVRVSLVRIGILPVQSTGYEHAEQRILEAIAQHQVTSPAFATLLLQVFLLFFPRLSSRVAVSALACCSPGRLDQCYGALFFVFGSESLDNILLSFLFKSGLHTRALARASTHVHAPTGGAPHGRRNSVAQNSDRRR